MTSKKNTTQIHINENYVSQLTFNKKVIQSLVNTKWNHYPTQALYAELEKSAAHLYQCAVKDILPSNGSDDGIFLTMQAFALENRKKPILLLSPTFSMYQHYAHILGLDIVESKLTEEFLPNFTEIENLIDEHTPSLVFIPNPLAPTGRGIEKARIELLISRYPHVRFVIDEAYIEFAQQASTTPLVKKYANVIVLRTLSKFYGLAALRIGFVISHYQQKIKKIQSPFSISVPNALLAIHALQHLSVNTLKTIKKDVELSRKALLQTLHTMPSIEQYSVSDANFVFVLTAKHKSLHDFLEKNGFLIKDLSHQYAKALRIGIPSPQDTKRLIKLLEKFETKRK